MTDKETRREDLILTAREVFFQYGVRKTTIDDIAQACGMTKSSLYHYFSGKEDLIRAVARMVMDENLEKYEAVVAKEIPLVDSLAALIKTIIARQKEMYPKFLASLEEVLELIPMLKDVITGYQQSVLNLIKKRLTKAVEMGEYNNLPVEEFSSILMILIHHQVKQCTDPSMAVLDSSDPYALISLLLDPYRGTSSAAGGSH
ncbi:TetR/AcrR family transcriptional regulator [bacterium]|nr:TetR/AcrR family transcriptional regulator [bacterium]